MAIARNSIRAFGLLAVVSILAAFARPASAETLPPPTGDVVLTVSGKIAVTNSPGAAAFDIAMLRRLPRAEFATSTIWTDGVGRFEGVRLDVLLDAVGADGASLKATALNDYSTEIPASDATPDGPIVAYAIDGAAMSVRDKGPLWIVYPYDADSRFKTERIYGRSIWQLNRIEISD